MYGYMLGRYKHTATNIINHNYIRNKQNAINYSDVKNIDRFDVKI